MNQKIILNAIGFNAVWFAWALGVPAKQTILPAFLSLLFIGWHFKVNFEMPNKIKQDAITLTLCLGAGLVLDGVLQRLGWVQFAVVNPEPFDWLQPWWMSLIWLSFACTMHHSMAWLGRLHWLFAAALCGTLGYLSYAGAAKLGALQLAAGYKPVALLFGFWAVFIPLLQKHKTIQYT
jgi:hypothetical protein